MTIVERLAGEFLDSTLCSVASSSNSPSANRCERIAVSCSVFALRNAVMAPTTATVTIASTIQPRTVIPEPSGERGGR